MKEREIMKVLGQKWKEISDGDKLIYERLAEKDKIRYQDGMNAFNAAGRNQKTGMRTRNKKII